VRAYTRHGLIGLFDGLPARIVHHSRIYGGYDNLVPRFGKPMIVVKNLLQAMENTPLNLWGLSHLLVVEKTSSAKSSQQN
jgi:hypothetical protein